MEDQSHARAHARSHTRTHARTHALKLAHGLLSGCLAGRRYPHTSFSLNDAHQLARKVHGRIAVGMEGPCIPDFHSEHLEFDSAVQVHGVDCID
eukprot:3772515-Pleurochrysis_carterae.AAC.1